MTWADLHHAAGTTPIRNPHHRAFPWPSDCHKALPVATCYVLARDPRPWHRVMVVDAVNGLTAAARVVDELTAEGWADARVCYGRPRLRAGWLYVTREAVQ